MRWLETPALNRFRLAGLTLVWLFALIPSVNAASIDYIDDKAIIVDQTTIYSRGYLTESWKLISQSSETNTALVFEDKLFLTDGRQVKWTENGIFYNSLPLPTGVEQVRLQLHNSALWLIGQGTGGLWVGQIKQGKYHPSKIDGHFELERVSLETVQDRNYLLNREEGEVILYEPVNDQTWHRQLQFACSNAQLGRGPTLGLLCADGRFYQLDNRYGWTKLSDRSFSSLQATTTALVGIAPEALLVVTPTRTVEVMFEAGKDFELQLVGSRLLIRSSAGWEELVWTVDQYQLVTVTADPTLRLYYPDKNGSSLALTDSNDLSLLSDQPLSWQSVKTSGSWNHILRLPSGWLMYQTDQDYRSGGLAQWWDGTSEITEKVNAWSSTTSPIVAANLTQPPARVLVRTSSGNGRLNLYESTDYRSWRRVTLPSESTKLVSIGEARQLAVGDNVILRGTVSVPVGVVGSSIAYLQDQMAGIQIYASSGLAELVVGQELTLAGQMSSSTVKRVLIEGIELGEKSSVSLGWLEADNLGQLAGRIGRLRGKVSSIATEDLNLAGVKVHSGVLANRLKELFQIGDELTLTVLTDWNSSSKKNEAWIIGQEYEIHDRVPPPVAPAPMPVAAKPAATKTKPVAKPSPPSVRQTVTPAKTAASTPVKTSLIGASTDQPISSVNNSQLSQYQTLTIIGLSFIVGLIGVSGRRPIRKRLTF